MNAAGVDRAWMLAQPAEHHGDIAFGPRGRADFLNAHIVHVEDAVALHDVAERVDRPDFIGEPMASAEPLDEIEIGFGRRAEPQNDDMRRASAMRFSAARMPQNFASRAGISSQ
jgi:hypothetical protein